LINPHAHGRVPASAQGYEKEALPGRNFLSFVFAAVHHLHQQHPANTKSINFETDSFTEIRLILLKKHQLREKLHALIDSSSPEEPAEVYSTLVSGNML
jgi:hypothetical protein